MTLLQAAAALTLWKSGRFDTLDIARAIGVEEWSVVTLLDAVRTAERGPEFRVIEGSIA